MLSNAYGIHFVQTADINTSISIMMYQTITHIKSINQKFEENVSRIKYYGSIIFDNLFSIRFKYHDTVYDDKRYPHSFGTVGNHCLSV